MPIHVGRLLASSAIIIATARVLGLLVFNSRRGIDLADEASLLNADRYPSA